MSGVFSLFQWSLAPSVYQRHDSTQANPVLNGDYDTASLRWTYRRQRVSAQTDANPTGIKTGDANDREGKYNASWDG